jgi:hypothetical protein
MKNRALVGQPILAAAAFQAAFFSLRAGLAKGTGGGFSTLSPVRQPAKYHEKPDARAGGSVRSRSFSRVPDVSSVILRDSIIWLAFEDLLSPTGRETSLLPYKLERIRSSFSLLHPPYLRMILSLAKSSRAGGAS